MAAKAKNLTTNRPVTLKQLAATLADEHQLTKRAGLALLGDLVGQHGAGARRIQSSQLLARRTNHGINVRPFVRDFNRALRSGDDLSDRLAGTHPHLVDRQTDLTKVLEDCLLYTSPSPRDA